MGIASFIQQDILLPRLRKHECLVLYDPDRRYRELCLEMASEAVSVIDVGEGSILSREQARQAMDSLAINAIEALLVYVPAPAPTTDEQRQADPFFVYARCGAQFPAEDSDEYLSLCLRARPEYSAAIRKIFQDQPSPSFATIDAVGGGVNWPQLQTVLKAQSASDILIGLLVPSEKQRKALQTDEGWLYEVRDFLKDTLGLTLKTRGKTWNALTEELWRFLLFSEFVFDLPEALPEALRAVPRAPTDFDFLVNDLCERLRNDQRHSAQYIARAEAIEREMALATTCAGIENLGERDTFPFEERTFLKRAVSGLLTDDPDRTRQLLERHRQSVWRSKGENEQQWTLVQAALDLLSACEDFGRLLADHSRSMESLIRFYADSLRNVDRLHRQFEQTVGGLSADDLLDAVIVSARAAYRRLSERVQLQFTRHLESTGWPTPGFVANTSVFDRYVAPGLAENGHRTAYLMIDALRYELGVELGKQLTEVGQVELLPACAQLPTITLVGMASLLPGAQTDLTLECEKDAIAPKLKGVAVGNSKQRMDLLKKRYGVRFAEMTLKDFLKKAKVEPTVDLLVLRSTEIDAQLENNPEETLSLIPLTLRQIKAALDRLGDLGFRDAVVASDHGFSLNAQAGAGDVCQKPVGTWPCVAHDRMLLGNGTPDGYNLVFTADKLGIRGSFAQAALPRTMAPYRAGHLYFHGGASLVEAIVPVLLVRLESSRAAIGHQVELSYKQGARRITTRLPVIEVSAPVPTLSHDNTFEILLEAQDAKGNVVGEPRPGEGVNPATRTITLPPCESKKIVLKMDAFYEGPFTVKAMDPKTLTVYCTLKLETDYTV